MATVPTIDNQLLPSAEGGSSTALGSEFRQAVLPQEEAAMQKWNSAITLGKVAQDFSNKIHEARNTKGYFDSMLYAEEEFRKLDAYMQSPDFAANTKWQDYGAYYDKEAARIHREALEKNKGYIQPVAMEKLDFALRGQVNKYKSRSDSLARTGEVMELRTDVLNGYNKYKELVVKADSAGDKDGVADYSSQMVAILNSARQARVITANEYENMLDNFNNDVKKVLWTNRILDASTIVGPDGEPDYKTRAEKLGLIAQQLEQPLTGFDDVLRTNLRATALHQMESSRRGETKRDHFEITTLNEREKNNLTAVVNGETTEMLSFGEYQRVYGDKHNEAKAQYQQYTFNWDTAFAVSQARQIINDSPIENYQQEIQSIREAGKVSGKPYAYDKAADAADVQARKNIGMILEDPARFATEIQKVNINDPAKIVSELRRIGVPDKDLSVIPDKVAKQEVSKIRSMSQLDATKYIQQDLANKYGGKDSPLFRIAMRDLQKAKLPFAYEFAATSLDPKKDQAFIEELTKANELTPAKYKSITGLDMESSVVYKAFTEFVPQKMAPLVASYSNPNVSPENTEKAGKMLQSAMNLAMYRSLYDLNAAGNAADIAEGVANDFISKYNIIYNDPNWIRSGGQQPFAIPKHYNVDKAEMKAIKPVLITKELPAILDTLDKRLQIEKGAPPMTPEVKADLIKDFTKNSMWVNSGSGSDDLILIDKRGIASIRINPLQIRRYIDSGTYELAPAAKTLPPPAAKNEPISYQPSSGGSDAEALRAQGGPRIRSNTPKMTPEEYKNSPQRQETLASIARLEKELGDPRTGPRMDKR